MKIHIVKKGDTLYELSQKYGVELQKIIEANPQISNPDALVIGDKVKIPAAPTMVPENNNLYYKHTVKQGDSLWKLSKAWGITLKEIIDANPQLKNPNALMTGEIVNIPKKANNSVPNQPESIQSNAPSEQPQTVQSNEGMVQPMPIESAESAVVDKTKVGGKTYTGPMEQPPQAIMPNITPPPVPAPLPVPAALPNKAPEAPPVQEFVHETQSLFVQISVPTQEAVVYEMPKEKEKEKEKSDVYPSAWTGQKTPPCDKTAGYPGLGQNPYVNDFAPISPYYEQQMPMMGMNANPAFVQQTAYMPDYMSPYSYPGNEYPAAADYSNAWYPGAMPDYANAVSPDMNYMNQYPAYGMPQYGGQSANLPWPSCGCGGGMPVQPYAYDQYAFNNNMPPFMAQPETLYPYNPGASQIPNATPAAPMGMPGNFAVSGIPAYPAYPGMENNTHHNRVPEILEPEIIAQEAPQAEKNIVETAVKGKTGAGKGTAKVVKTSAKTSDKSAKNTSKQRSSQSARTSASNNRKNPWIQR